MTNVLQKQCQDLVTAQDMMLHLKEMFGEQSRRTPVREHVLKMISFINKLDMLGAEIDSETQVDAILASLPASFNQFIMNYDMNKMVVTLLELLNMLKAAKDLIKKEKPTVMLVEKSDTSLKLKPNGKNFKRKGSQSFNKAQGDKVNKDAEKKKAKGNCFHCGKPGHWKRNCCHYLASLKNDKPAEEGMLNLLVIETNLMDGPFDSWCVDSGTISYICNMSQGFKETRRLKEGEPLPLEPFI
ncbi:hypothetical protein RGQ29_025143 [Quercus rubra]|uniref:CCHC-type domain-containing protein n=1 Tax=Quercus rubra TaxID=3512 RepID=A0AAN7IHK9_QUERU|nr:hypothetical protein RGQ29_025143 [Quercus rubra]